MVANHSPPHGWGCVSNILLIKYVDVLPHSGALPTLFFLFPHSHQKKILTVLYLSQTFFSLLFVEKLRRKKKHQLCCVLDFDCVVMIGSLISHWSIVTVHPELR